MEQNGNEHICVCIFWGGSEADMRTAEFSSVPGVGRGGGGGASKSSPARTFENLTAVGDREQEEEEEERLVFCPSLSSAIYLAAIFSWPANAKRPFAIYLSCVTFRQRLPGVSPSLKNFLCRRSGLEGGGRLHPSP